MALHCTNFLLQVLDYFVQICLALKHVHDRKILHRDLKSQVYCEFFFRGMDYPGCMDIRKLFNLYMDDLF